MLAANTPKTKFVDPEQVEAQKQKVAVASMIAEAQRAFNGHRFNEAEERYWEVLAADPQNIAVCGNLAAAQMEQNKLDDAEKSIKHALGVDPNDGFSLALLGLLRFRQARPDEAVAALSDAAKIDPNDARTQLYLGLALNQRGEPAAAEAALRKAVRISPDYSEAHYNLAVFYATAKPPSKGLAQWHYEKALATGHEKVAELEKLLP